MALAEDILSAIDAYQPSQEGGGQQEISFKITPRPPVPDATGQGNQPSSVGGQTGGGGGLGSAALPMAGRLDPSMMAGMAPGTNMIAGPTGFGPEGQTLATPQQQGAPRNPQLPAVPTSPYIDDIFTAQVAMLRNEATKQYLELQRQLGFTDESGAFIPGSIETEGARRRYDLGYARDRAQEAVTGDVRRRSAVFSGRHSELQAQARQPFDRDLARLEAAIPQMLADAFSKMMQTLTDVGLGQNMYLAEAAARAAEAARNKPAGPTGTGTGETSTATTASTAALPSGMSGGYGYVTSPFVGVPQGGSGVHVPGRGTHLTDADNEGGMMASSPQTATRPAGIQEGQLWWENGVLMVMSGGVPRPVPM